MKTLRKYQNECVEAIEIQHEKGNTRTVAQLPTGGGKTVVCAEFIRRFRLKSPGARVVFLVHRQEILTAAAATIAIQNPDATVGVVDGDVKGVERDKQAARDIVCINTATLGVSAVQRSSNGKRMNTVNKLHSQIKGTKLVILDEAHRGVSSTARDCLVQLGCFEETDPVPLIGFTATPFRDDKEDLNEIFQSLAYAKSITDLIEMSALVEPKHMVAMVEGLDLNKVGTSRMSTGEVDLNATELDRVMEESGSYGVVAEFVKRHLMDRKTIVFTPNVHSADMVADKLNKLGIKSVSISGTTKSSVRAAAFEAIQTSDLQCIVNCQIATEGTDIPIVSGIVIARPTRSRGLYRQMVGRGVRLYAGKTDCIVVDLVGATTRNDLVTISDLDDGIDDILAGETLVEAKQRAQVNQTRLNNFAGAVNRAIAELDEEAAEDLIVVSGSFNLWEVDNYSPEQIAKKMVSERAQGKEKQRLLNLPQFPAVEKFGPWLVIGDCYTMSLKDWTNKGTTGSYVCFMEIEGQGWVVFRKDNTKSWPQSHDFVTKSFYSTLEEAEKVAMEFGQGSLPSGVWNYNVNPKSKTKTQAASAKLQGVLSSRGIKRDEIAEVKAKKMKAPSTGVAGDWLAYCDISRDVLKQEMGIREYFAEGGTL